MYNSLRFGAKFIRWNLIVVCLTKNRIIHAVREKSIDFTYKGEQLIPFTIQFPLVPYTQELNCQLQR